MTNEVSAYPVPPEAIIKYIDFSKVSESPMFRTRGFFKPFNYQWAFDAYELQHQLHWVPREVPMANDISDWNDRLNGRERNLLTHLFRFFTQGDVDVANAYYGRYIKIFKNEELRMMMGSFASMEAVHADAYSKLLESIGMPEAEYKAFYSYEQMAAKHDYLQELEVGSLEDVALNLAAYSMMTEGMQLYSSFAVLMNFPRHGKMNNMGQIVAWSIRDEDLHSTMMIRVFRQLVNEHPGLLNDALKRRIYDLVEDMVGLEDHFIDLMFEEGAGAEGEIEGLTADDVKGYIRFIANVRLDDAGLKKIYVDHMVNPFPWLVMLTQGKEHVNFFEQRNTSYSTGTATHDWDDVWAKRGAGRLHLLEEGQ
jgi:ribonucleoside-diphosphate reductase beta chain